MYARQHKYYISINIYFDKIEYGTHANKFQLRGTTHGVQADLKGEGNYLQAEENPYSKEDSLQPGHTQQQRQLVHLIK